MAQDCCSDRSTVRVESRTQRKDDALSAMTWGAGLVWGGLVWLENQSGTLAAAHVPLSAGAVFFLGIGLIFAVAITITLVAPGYRHADFGAYVVCAGAIGLGLSGWTPAWPVVVIALGAVLIAQSVARSRHSAS